MAIKNGETADADEVMNALASTFNETIQNLFQLDYEGFNSKLYGDNGSPNILKLKYSTLQSDVAISETDYTYNASLDRYDADSAGATPIITLGDLTDVGVNVTNVFVILNEDLREYTTEAGIVDTPGFEADVGDWTYTEDDGAFVISGAYSGAEFHSGSQSYLLTASTDGNTNSYGQIAQTVDLTGIVQVKLWYKRTTDNGDNAQYGLKVFEGSNELYTESFDNLALNTWTQITVYVPITSRGTGKSLVLRFYMGTPATQGATIYLDDVTTIGNETIVEPVLTFSNDNSTFAVCENQKVFRPATTGQKLVLTATYTLSGSQEYVEGYVSEYAIKYNLY